MKSETASTYTVLLKMAGDIQDAKRIIRLEVYPPNEGLCVTIDRTLFIYSGGEEEGFVVGFLNYPRFPSEPDALWTRAKNIALKLMSQLGQWSALMVAPDKTEWLNCRPEGR